MTIVIIMLGVCTGIFTTTESAAIACVYALIITLFVYKSIKVKDIWGIAKKSLATLAMILSIIAAANAFCYLMSLMQVPAKITQMLLTISDNRYVVLILINILLLVLGCFMDVAPLILIMTPILLPVVEALGMGTGSVWYCSNDESGNWFSDAAGRNNLICKLCSWRNIGREGDKITASILHCNGCGFNPCHLRSRIFHDPAELTDALIPSEKEEL